MWRVIGFFFKSSWKVIVFAGVASAIAAGANLYALRLLGEIIIEKDQNLYLLLAYVSCLVIVSSVITLFVGKYVLGYFESKVARYRKELATKTLHSKYGKIERKLDKLVPILLFETGAIGGFGKSIPDLMVALFQSIVVLGYLFYLSLSLTLVFVPIFVLIAITNMVTLPYFKKIEEKISKTRFSLHYSLDRMEKGFKNLVVNEEHSGAYIDRAIDGPSRGLVGLSVKNFYLRTLLEKSQNAFLIICLGLLIVYAMMGSAFSEAELIEYMALVLFIRPSLNTIANFSKQVKTVENALEQVESLDVDIRESLFKSESKIMLDETSTSPLIKINNATYEYGGDNPFKLQEVDFEINRNEIVIINGSNGSGKSTLFKLIVGLYSPQKGEVLFQDELVHDNNIQSYRSYYSCYFTDSPLFDDLAYVINEQNSERATELIGMLGLDDKTTIDQDFKITNSHLSNGQKGRLNLLRLLMEDREIYFLDEWAANQDIYFKEKFYTQIIPDLKKRGKTVILISHDDKFYSVGDRIITLKRGRIENITLPNATI